MDCRRITEVSLLSPYTEAIGETKENKRGAKPVRHCSFLFGDSGIVTKSPQRRHKELTKKATIRIYGE